MISVYPIEDPREIVASSVEMRREPATSDGFEDLAGMRGGDRGKRISEEDARFQEIQITVIFETVGIKIFIAYPDV